MVSTTLKNPSTSIQKLHVCNGCSASAELVYLFVYLVPLRYVETHVVSAYVGKYSTRRMIGLHTDDVAQWSNKRGGRTSFEVSIQTSGKQRMKNFQGNSRERKHCATKLLVNWLVYLFRRIRRLLFSCHSRN